jgi:hypothetical protein
LAFYLIHARIRPDLREKLRSRLQNKEFENIRPFGLSLTQGLEGARLDPKTGEAVWEEEDYCSPPLAQERAAVLDRYFDGLRFEAVDEGQGWARIEHLPSLWNSCVAC